MARNSTERDFNQKRTYVDKRGGEDRPNVDVRLTSMIFNKNIYRILLQTSQPIENFSDSFWFPDTFGTAF